MKTWKIILILLLFFSASFLVLYGPILQPSYFSVVSMCDSDGEDILREHNMTLAGQTTVTYNETGIENISVILYYNDTAIRKHEFVHVVQAKQNRLFGCNNQIFMYICEMEAYTMQRLPDNIFEMIYGEF